MDVPSSFQPRKPGILVADDEPAICDMLRAHLEGRGFVVFTALDGKEAMEVYQTHQNSIDLALLDVMMPRQNGVETLDALHQIQPKLPCCFMSGLLDSKALLELVTRGALGVFSKPLDLHQLIATVWQLVKGSEAEEI